MILGAGAPPALAYTRFVQILLNGWFPLLRILVIGVLAYVGLIILLRLTGKRTLSKMNAFDFVVTVALGSTLATVIISKDVPLAEGLLALALLVLLQYAVAFLSVRWNGFHRLVKSQPRLLFWRGHFLRQEMRQERVTESEIVAVVRAQGLASIEQVEAVVIETAGELSVSKSAESDPPTSLRHVRGVQQVAEGHGDGQT